MLDEKIKEAFEYHQRGLNCAQSVALPFCEELGMPCSLATRALEGFGAGMGGRGQTCGALSGAVFLAGLKFSDGDLEAPASKQKTYAACKEICDQFTAACGSAVCADIKESHTLSCEGCIELGVKLAYDLLK